MFCDRHMPRVKEHSSERVVLALGFLGAEREEAIGDLPEAGMSDDARIATTDLGRLLILFRLGSHGSLPNCSATRSTRGPTLKTAIRSSSTVHPSGRSNKPAAAGSSRSRCGARCDEWVSCEPPRKEMRTGWDSNPWIGWYRPRRGHHPIYLRTLRPLLGHPYRLYDRPRATHPGLARPPAVNRSRAKRGISRRQTHLTGQSLVRLSCRCSGTDSNRYIARASEGLDPVGLCCFLATLPQELG